MTTISQTEMTESASRCARCGELFAECECPCSDCGQESCMCPCESCKCHPCTCHDDPEDCGFATIEEARAAEEAEILAARHEHYAASMQQEYPDW